MDTDFMECEMSLIELFNSILGLCSKCEELSSHPYIYINLWEYEILHINYVQRAITGSCSLRVALDLDVTREGNKALQLYNRLTRCYKLLLKRTKQ